MSSLENRGASRDVFRQKGLDKIVGSSNHLGFSKAQRASGVFPVRSLKRAEYSECQEASASIASSTGSQPVRKIDHQNSDQEVAGKCPGQGIRCGTRPTHLTFEAFGPNSLQGDHPFEQGFAYQESAESLCEESGSRLAFEGKPTVLPPPASEDEPSDRWAFLFVAAFPFC